MTKPCFTFDPISRLLAAALAGEPDAVQTLADTPDHRALIVSNRIAPGLAIRASELGITGPEVETWTTHMRSAAVQRLCLENARNQLGAIFSEIGIPWIPLKGVGFDNSIYPRPEERLSTDIDIMIRPEDVEKAVDALVAQGWRDLIKSENQRRFVFDEGYNWKASSPDGVFTELHFRLWGGVSESFASTMFERAEPFTGLGPGARRLTTADAYLIAAVHAWQTPSPRYLALWWDLQRLAHTMDHESERETTARATEYGLQLFVALSSAVAYEYWNHPAVKRIADANQGMFGLSERIASRVLRASSPGAASLGVITLGRLAAGRPSRTGWRAIPRQLWPHPGVVELKTPESWSWPRRRLTLIARKLQLMRD